MYLNKIRINSVVYFTFLTDKEAYSIDNPLYIALQARLVSNGFEMTDNHDFYRHGQHVQFQYQELDMLLLGEDTLRILVQYAENRRYLEPREISLLAALIGCFRDPERRPERVEEMFSAYEVY